MSGIRSYGCYIPFHRLKRSEIGETYGGMGKKGERAVAYYDEDSLTMAVAAAQNAFDGHDIDRVDAVYFASTTAPYLEKECATQIAAVLDVGKELSTADFSHSLRACASAMILADRNAARGETTMVGVGDCRMGGADGANEAAFGDGGAAFLFSDQNVIAKTLGTCSISAEYHDNWRGKHDAIVRNWDVRYHNTQHYLPYVQQAVKKILSLLELEPKDFSKIVLYAHDERYQKECALKLGFTPEQLQPCLYTDIGNTGAAAAPIMLAAALDEAAPGEKILYVSYSDGCDVMAFETTEAIASYRPNRTVHELIAHKDNTIPYGKYLKWRELLVFEPQKRPQQERSSLPDYYRNYMKIQGVYGSICTECGTPQFPPQRVCVNCRSIDKMRPYRFYGRPATVRTFTMDGLSLSLDPPNYLVVVDFEGGGKMMTYLVDCRPEDISVGMKVSLSFRRIFEANGVSTYFWKVVPAFEKEGK